MNIYIIYIIHQYIYVDTFSRVEMYLDKVPITAITKLWLFEFLSNFHV